MRPLLARRDAVELGEVAEVVEGAEALVEPPVAAEDVADVPAHLAGVGDDVVTEHGRALPPVGSSSVISILIVVVLPAPLGPSRPNSSPGSIPKLTPRTASTSSALPAERAGAGAVAAPEVVGLTTAWSAGSPCPRT